MKPIIALWAMTALSVLAIWNCFSIWRAMKKANKRDTVKLLKELSNSVYGTIVVVIVTILSWVI